jgi:DnaJ-class molecular chaperone
MEMWVCKDCVSKPEIRNELSLIICGDMEDHSVCYNCGGTNLIIFDGTNGCEGCPCGNGECVKDDPDFELLPLKSS